MAAAALLSPRDVLRYAALDSGPTSIPSGGAALVQGSELKSRDVIDTMRVDLFDSLSCPIPLASAHLHAVQTVTPVASAPRAGVATRKIATSSCCQEIENPLPDCGDTDRRTRASVRVMLGSVFDEPEAEAEDQGLEE